jgi:hypothetical protein
MDFNQILELFKSKFNRKGSNTSLIIIILLLLGLGTSLYFNMTSPNRQVVFNFNEQVDSLVAQKYDSIRQEMTNFYQPRILSYEELVQSTNGELDSLRDVLKFKDIALRDLQNQINVGITVKDEAVIPIERIESMKDSLFNVLSETLTEALTAEISDSLATDSTTLVENLMSDSTFIQSMLDRLAGTFLSNGQVQFVDTTTNLKYFGVLDLDTDSLYRSYTYNIGLQSTTFVNRNGFGKKPTMGLALTVDDPNAVLDVETFFVTPPKLNFVISAGIGGGLYWDTKDNTVGIAPTATITLGVPLVKFYSRRN